jgi:hypothetical protein
MNQLPLQNFIVLFFNVAVEVSTKSIEQQKDITVCIVGEKLDVKLTVPDFRF